MMSNYQTITGLLGGKSEAVLQETLVTPLETLQQKTKAVSERNPTAPNQLAKEKLEGMADRLMACLKPSNPLKLFS